MLFATSEYYLETFMGTAGESVGALGWRRELFEWKEYGFESAGEAFVPLKWKEDD